MRGWVKASCAMLFCLGAAGVRRGMAEKTMQAKLAEDNWPAFLHSGPYSTVTSDATLAVTVGASAEPCTLRLYFTSPARTPNMQPRSIPVVIVFNGFQLPASYYSAYKNALSSWGYVAIGYDVPGAVLKKIIRDDDEVKLIPALLDWLHQQSMDPSSALYEIVDTRQVAGFGHSRGAKLAALALPGNVGGLQAAVLVDPVDMTATTRAQHYPSAIDALIANPRKALLIGAGITGWCNPADEGWAAFWPHLSPGSWKHKLLPAGHAQFLDVKGAAAWGLDRLCGAGNITHKTAIHLAQGASIAWLQDTFRQQESKAAVAAYLSWVTQKEQADMIEWEVKPEPQPQVLKPQLQPQPQLLEPVLATAARS